MDGFKEVKRYVRRSKPSEDQKKKVLNSFLDKLEVVKRSSVFSELKEKISSLKITERKVRCLALGSVSQESLLLYQYLLLVLLVELIEIDIVSLWDPLFNDTDEQIFAERGFKIEKTIEDPGTYFYFMPHIPIEVLELVIAQDKPCYMLTNNLSVYSDKWTNSQLYQKFKFIALVKNCCDQNTLNCSVTKDKDNGFEIVVAKKNRRNRKKFVEAKIEYDYTGCYFETCKSIGFESSKDLSQIYGSAFSDMALYHLE